MERNKRNQLIFQHADQHAQEQDKGYWATPAVSSTSESAPTRAATTEAAWEGKVTLVRNRLTGRKHAAAERWNRFSATSGSGGRGR